MFAWWSLGDCTLWIRLGTAPDSPTRHTAPWELGAPARRETRATKPLPSPRDEDLPRLDHHRHSNWPRAAARPHWLPPSLPPPRAARV